MLTLTDYPTRFSPVDAARVAMTTEATPLTVPRRRVIATAAKMWCRDLSFPTVRALGAAICRSPATVLHGFDHAIRIHAEVIRMEWLILQGLDSTDALLDHAHDLASADRVLLRLPALVNAAVTSTGMPEVDAQRRTSSEPLYLLAAFAEPSASARELPIRAGLRLEQLANRGTALPVWVA